MIKKISVTLFLIAFLFVSPCYSQQSDNNFSSRVDSFFWNLNTTDTPGAAVLVVKNGKVLVRKGYGLANLEHKAVVTPSTVITFYQSKDGKEEKIFDALEWLAAMCSHVPNKGEQTVRYYGHYSNVARGRWKKQDRDGFIPSILEPEGSSEEFRKNWARLIKKSTR